MPAAPLPARTPDGGAAESSEAAAPTRSERAAVRAASRAARSFLRGYLPYSYARADAQAITAITPGLAARARAPATTRAGVARAPCAAAADPPAALKQRARRRVLLAHIRDGVSDYVAL